MAGLAHTYNRSPILETKVNTIESNRPALSREELEAVLQCLIDDQIGSGSVVERLEKALADATGFKKSLAVDSLTAAYHLSFLALNSDPTTTVWLSTLSSVSALDAARYTGASVRLLDVNRDSFHISIEQIINDANQNDIFILDHTFGSVFPESIQPIKDKGIHIIEDITGIIGSTQPNGEIFGQQGDITVCGLAENDLITTGNGAFICTNQKSYLKKMSELRYGKDRDLHSIGYDYRLEDFQAAIGLHQVSRLGQMLTRRKKIGVKYIESLRSTKHQTYFQLPGSDTYHRMPIIISRSQEEVLRYFKSLHIGVEKIPTPLHHYLAMPSMEYPNSERIFRRSVCVPVYPALTANNVERVAGSLRSFL